MLYAGIGTGLDQWRGHPAEWGQGWDSLGVRFTSHIGQHLAERSIMFPLQAIDHEDPRYFYSTKPTYKGRLMDALLHTVRRRNDSGGMMPAYSEFVGEFGGVAISRLWWPEEYRTAHSILVSGANAILIDASLNVLREFTPDLKRLIFRKH